MLSTRAMLGMLCASPLISWITFPSPASTNHFCEHADHGSWDCPPQIYHLPRDVVLESLQLASSLIQQPPATTKEN